MESGKTSLAGKLGGSLFGLIFFLAGSFFFYFLCVDLYGSIQTRLWEKTPCMIEESKVVLNNGEYKIEVEYSYEKKGSLFTFTVYDLKNTSHEKQGDLLLKAQQLMSNPRAFCFVNPDNHSQAVLVHGNLVMGFFIILPLIFMLVGGGIIYASFKNTPLKESKLEKIKGSENGKGLKIIFTLFFAVFLFAGIAAGFYIWPNAYKTLDSSGWIKTQCTILNSRVARHYDSDGTTYSIDISFTYNINGKTFQSGKYDLMNISSSGSSSKQKVVRNYPKGKKTYCYVNPDNHYEAVLNNQLGWEILFALFPLPFIAVGLGGFYFVIVKKQTYKTGRMKKSKTQKAKKNQETINYRTGKIILKKESSKLGRIIGMLFFALFWNGIVSVFVFQAFYSFQRGNPEWFLIIFLIPFVLVGIGVIILFFYFVLTIFNPEPTIEIANSQIYLGDKIKGFWTIKGNKSRLTSFTIEIEGEEKATYRRGTSTHTDTSCFYSKKIFETSNELIPENGNFIFTIPENSMHTFKSSNNEITWHLKVNGDIPKWPDISENFQLFIQPLKMKEFLKMEEKTRE